MRNTLASTLAGGRAAGCAPSGAAKASITKIDLRLLPGMNGLDLQQRLIARPTPMPIVFVSAHEEAAMRATALRAGAIAFLNKPFDNSALLDALNRSIR